MIKIQKLKIKTQPHRRAGVGLRRFFTGTQTFLNVILKILRNGYKYNRQKSFSWGNQDSRQKLFVGFIHVFYDLGFDVLESQIIRVFFNLKLSLGNQF